MYFQTDQKFSLQTIPVKFIFLQTCRNKALGVEAFLMYDKVLTIEHPIQAQ